jgi:hypothetical protein
MSTLSPELINGIITVSLASLLSAILTIVITRKLSHPLQKSLMLKSNKERILWDLTSYYSSGPWDCMEKPREFDRESRKLAMLLNHFYGHEHSKEFLEYRDRYKKILKENYSKEKSDDENWKNIVLKVKSDHLDEHMEDFYSRLLEEL